MMLPDQSIVDILLVEDNPDDLELALHALRKHNLANSIHIARDGVEALEFLFGNPATGKNGVTPKLVLLDLKLPKVDGLEVLRRIRAAEQTRLIPVVMLTTSREESDIVTSYELGVNSYIVKPVDFQQFTEAVRHLGYYWLLTNQSPNASL